jgi:serine/threonine protein kinase
MIVRAKPNSVPAYITASLKILEELDDVKADSANKKIPAPVMVPTITYPEGTLKYNDITFGEIIGDGHSGIVYSGKYLNKPVAIKSYGPTYARHLSAMIVNEFHNMDMFQSPYILKAIGYTFNPPCLVTELMPKGSLLDLMESEKLSLYALIKIALDAARGVKELHDKGMVHRDIKSANILVDEKYHAKLADLEFAKKVSDVDGTSRGTFIYMPLECYFTDGKSGSDIYSFGIFLLELVLDYQTFENYFDRPLLHHIQELKSGQWQKQIKETLFKMGPEKYGTVDFLNLILDCIQKNAEARPLITKVISSLEAILNQLSIEILKLKNETPKKVSSLGLFKQDKAAKKAGQSFHEIPLHRLSK